jgi:hypothetical protein
MKLPIITGKIFKVAKVRSVPKGFTQVVIITQPERKNEQGYTLSKEQFFVVHIWSNKENDSRFLKEETKAEGAECHASCYLDGQRWSGRNGFEYNHRINLDKWLTDEEVANLKSKTHASA